MQAYVNDEKKLMSVALIVTILGVIAILSSPFIFNEILVFYACVVLTIIAGLYLSRNLAYAGQDKASPVENRKQRKPRRRKKG